MFNTQVYKSETSVCPVTRVIEKTISPDKVTEMYDKVKDEVENNFVRKFIIKENNLHGVVTEHIENQLAKSKIIMVRFVLNNEEHIVKEIQPKEYVLDREKAVRKLVEGISNQIIKVILSNINLPI
jgi:hypothetical protein